MTRLRQRQSKVATLLLLLVLSFAAAERANVAGVEQRAPQTSVLASAFVSDANATLDIVSNSSASEVAVGDADAVVEEVGEPRDLAVNVASAPDEAGGENQPLVALKATALLLGGAAAVVLMLAAVSKAAEVNRLATGESLCCIRLRVIRAGSSLMNRHVTQLLSRQ